MPVQPTSPNAHLGSLTANLPQPRLLGWLQMLPMLLAISLIGLLAATDRSALMMAIQGLTRQLPDTLWSSLTMFGHGCVGMSLLALCWRDRPGLIVAGLCAIPIAGLFSNGLKTLIGGPRPAAVLPLTDLHVIGERLLNHSFPSGHTITAFVLIGIVLMGGRIGNTQRLLLLLLACAVGLSRVAVGAHWPLDVIAGAGIGWLAAICSLSLSRQFACLSTLATHRIAALLVLAASSSLLFSSCGYPLALGIQYGSALIGMACSVLWLRSTCGPLRARLPRFS